MRRLLLLFALVAAVVVALALAWATLEGDGADGERLAAKTIEVGPFRTVEVNGHADVVLVQGDRETVDIEASPRRHARIRVKAQGGALTITAGGTTRWWGHLIGGGARPPRITIALRELESLRLSGAVRVSTERLKVQQLAVHASGAASVRMEGVDAASFRFMGSGAVKGEMSGRATEQEVSISGAGTYRAPELESERAQVRVSGAGRVVVNARRTLDASISGAGAIDYLGNPEVRQRISGAGRIKQMTDGEAPRGRVFIALSGSATRASFQA
jgi:hypothetical protein